MTNNFSIEELNRFIVQAKAATYVGSGAKSLSHRPGSYDLEFHQGNFSYLDSYFGGTDFIGQEVVYYDEQPVWAMNYYGRIIRTELITAQVAGEMIKNSLSKLYEEGRFLGGFEHLANDLIYIDTNEGDLTSFTGREWITRDKVRVYELIYHGGLIKK